MLIDLETGSPPSNVKPSSCHHQLLYVCVHARCNYNSNNTVFNQYINVFTIQSNQYSVAWLHNAKKERMQIRMEKEHQRTAKSACTLRQLSLLLPAFVINLIIGSLSLCELIRYLLSMKQFCESEGIKINW